MAGSDHPLASGRVLGRPLVLGRQGWHWWLPGALALLVLFLLVGLPFVALLSEAYTGYRSQGLSEVLGNAYFQRVVWFSIFQACLSTLLAILGAIPLALALARRNSFPGRRLLLTLFSLSLIMPTVVAVFGIVAVYGRRGWLLQFLQTLGIDLDFNLYGLAGILLAHVFFNLPLATRIYLQSLEAVPATTWRLTAQLGLRSIDIFRLIEWPALRQQLPAVALLIFSLCFTSFAIVMTLGGGPRATTIEVAIYQAVRFDFDLSLAVTLALIQLSICILVMIATAWFSVNAVFQLNPGAKSMRFHRDHLHRKILDYTIITVALLFVVTPVAALLLNGINPSLLKVLMHTKTLNAVLNTTLVALCSGLLSVAIGCLLLITARHLNIRLMQPAAGRALELSGMLILVVPPVVLGTGLFILLRPYADVFSLALVLVVLVNALMSLPFVIRVMSGPMMENARLHDRLCSSLAIRGINRLRLIELPTLRKPLGLSLALATTLSAGDFTVIALFGSERVQTLPLLLYQRMGSYRMQDAAGTALLLLLLCLILFWLIDRIVGGRDAGAA